MNAKILQVVKADAGFMADFWAQVEVNGEIGQAYGETKEEAILEAINYIVDDVDVSSDLMIAAMKEWVK